MFYCSICEKTYVDIKKAMDCCLSKLREDKAKKI